MDEYTLASYMAGTLPAERREEVALYLSQNADARELLQMAHEALEASRYSGEPLELPALEVEAPPVPPKRIDRHPMRVGRRIHVVSRFAAMAVVVFTIGAGLRLSFGPSTDALRSSSVENALEITLGEPGTESSIEWSALPGAYQYRVVVWDPEMAQVVGRFETPSTRLADSEDFMQSIHPHLQKGHQYTLKIDAVDPQNRIMRSSETISFDK